MDKWFQILIRFDRTKSDEREYYSEWKRLVMVTGSTKKALMFLLRVIRRHNERKGVAEA